MLKQREILSNVINKTGAYMADIYLDARFVLRLNGECDARRTASRWTINKDKSWCCEWWNCTIIRRWSASNRGETAYGRCAANWRLLFVKDMPASVYDCEISPIPYLINRDVFQREEQLTRQQGLNNSTNGGRDAFLLHSTKIYVLSM